MAATQGWVAVNTTNVEGSILHSSEIQAYRLGNGADTTVVPWKFGETLGEVIARAEAVQESRDVKLQPASVRGSSPKAQAGEGVAEVQS